MSIEKINKNDIDFNKVYGTKYDAENQQNNVKVNEVYWGDNGELYFDTNTGMVSENGVALGYLNKDSFKSNDSNSSSSSSSSSYNGSYRDNSNIMNQASRIQSINNANTKSSDVSQTSVTANNNVSYQENVETEQIQPIEPIEDTTKENEVDAEIKIDETAQTQNIEPIEEVVEPTVEETAVEKTVEPPTEEKESVKIDSIDTVEADVDQSVAQETTAVPTTPGEAAPADGLIHYSSGYVSPFATDANTRISSDFGLRNAPKTSQGHGSSNHKGIDIAVPVGTKIHSISSGTVINSGPASGYGKWVRVQQDDGNVVTYGHVSNASIVSVGSRVNAGDVIALSGNEGNSSGPHLHLQINQGVGGPAVDPNNYLN